MGIFTRLLQTSSLLAISVTPLLSSEAFAREQYQYSFTPPAAAEETAAPEESAEEKAQKKKKKEDELAENENLSPEELAEIEPAIGPLAAPLLGTNALLGVGGAAAVGGGVAAAAGGGGGSDGDDSAPAGGGGNNGGGDPPPPPPPQNTEEDMQAGFKYVGADAAQARGITGNGIKVGIIDTGIDADSIEFQGTNIDCFDAQTGTTGCSGANPNITEADHGTFVAGIVGADDNGIGLVGIAPEADILNAAIFTNFGFDIALQGVSADKRADAINWAVNNGAQVTNHSYGFASAYNSPDQAGQLAVYADGTNIHAAMDNAVANDVILVWASGNQGLDQPNMQSALPLFFPEWEENWIVTTSVNTLNGEIATYANACGDTAAFCIAAPGGDVDVDGGLRSLIPNNFIGIWEGTSFAAPHVTGAVALALEAFGPGTPTNKTPEEIVDLVFATANKTGIYANTAIYGQGLLDVDALTKPDGPSMAFATGNSFEANTQLVNLTNTNFGPAFGDAAAQALSGRMAGANDRFNRVFLVDLGSLATGANAAIDSRKLLAKFGQDNRKVYELDNLGTLNVSFKSQDKSFFNSANLGSSNGGPDLESLSFTSDLSEGTNFHVDYKVNPGLRLGLQADGTMDNTLLTANEQSVNPYLDFAGEDGASAGFDLAVNDRIQTRILGFTTTEEQGDILIADREETDKASGAVVEASFQMNDSVQIGLMTGLMNEDENVLGSRSSGGFDLDDNTPTFFAGPSVNLKLNEKISVVGSWQFGVTDASTVENSLYEDLSDIQTDTFTAGVVVDKPFSEQDRAGLIVHQPLRVNKAEATLNVPLARADDGSVISASERINLEPSGRELNLQAFYEKAWDEDKSLSAGLMYRMEPGHVKDADSEGVGIVRYRFKF